MAPQHTTLLVEALKNNLSGGKINTFPIFPWKRGTVVGRRMIL
jgi:hypothetical protein